MDEIDRSRNGIKHVYDATSNFETVLIYLPAYLISLHLMVKRLVPIPLFKLLLHPRYYVFLQPKCVVI